MNTLKMLIKRNLKLFLRDKATVFFSFMSTLIMIMLYFLFIAKMYKSGMGADGGDAINLTNRSMDFIVYLQMMAGVLVLNSISLSTGVFSTIAKDFENKRIDNFLLTPTKSYQIILSYFISGLAASFILNIFTWVLSFLIIGLTCGYWLGIGAFITLLLILFVCSVISCSIMMLVTAIVKSSTAIGVITGIMGTFFGFLCGIYMPYSNLGESTKAVGSTLPFTHLTIWLKRTVLSDAFNQLGIEGEFKSLLMSEYFSAESVGFCGISAPLWVMLLASGIFALLCLTASYTLLNSRIKRNSDVPAPARKKKLAK